MCRWRVLAGSAAFVEQVARIEIQARVEMPQRGHEHEEPTAAQSAHYGHGMVLRRKNKHVCPAQADSRCNAVRDA